MTVIGSAYVNIRAITDKLEADVRKAIESINENLTIKVDADVSSATAKLKELSNSDLSDRKLNVDADTTAAKVKLNEIADMALGDQTISVDADTTAAKAKLEDVAKIALGDQTIHVNVDSNAANAELLNIANTASLLNATIHVDANTLSAREQFSRMEDDMNGQNVNVDVNLRDRIAQLRLLLLTRTRQLRIDVKADSAPLKSMGDAISKLSGLRVASGYAKELVEEFSNIDKKVMAIAVGAVKFGTIGGLAMSSVAGVSTLGASLGSVLTMIGVAGPGMLAGFAVGMGTLILSLKDMKKQLPGVVAEYKGLQAVASNNFWAQARSSVADLANTLFPLFRTGLAQTGSALGKWASQIADTAKFSLTENNRMKNMFDNLSSSITRAAAGGSAITDALIRIGSAGSAYLPLLADWFTKISIRFADFINKAEQDGKLTQWIETGITELKRLGELAGNIGGIFGGITRAAKAAGSDGLGTLVKFTDILNQAINAPYGINALKTIFEGANSVSLAFADALAKIFGGLASMAPSIKAAFESVAGVVGLLGGAIANILNDPQFQAGFTAMFDGIEKGAAALLPVLGQTGPKIGALLSIVGNLAANIGGILGAALQVTLPFITAFKQAIDPLIPILGDALIKIIQDLGPTFVVLADAIKQLAPVIADVVKWAADLVTQFVDFIKPALPEIAAGVLAFMGAWKTISVVSGIMKTVQTGIEGVKTAMSAYRAGLSLATAIQAGFNTTMLANPLGLIIAGIIALVAVIVVAYNNVGWFKDFVDGAFKVIQDIIAGLVSFWNTNVVPMWNDAMKAAGDFFNGIGQWFGDVVKNVQDFFNSFTQGAQDAQNGVGDFFNGLVGFVQDAINNVITWVTQNWGLLLSILIGPLGLVIQWVVDNWSQITDTISQVLDAIGVVWNVAWNAISQVFQTVWTNLVNFFQPLTDLIVAIVNGVITVVTAIWQVGWDIISTIFIGVWTNLVRFFTPIIDFIVQTIQTGIDWVVNAWNVTWQAISDFFVAVWNGIVAFITPIVQAISDTITGVVNGIVAVWNTVWQAISDFFIWQWNNIVAFYGPILQGIWDTIVNVVNAISATWNAVWGAVGDFFAGVWNGIIGFVTPIINQIRAVIIGVVLAVQAGWNNTWSAIGNFFSDTWNNIVNGVNQLVSGIQNGIQTALDTVGRIGSDILRSVGDFGNLLYNAGGDLLRGLANGITDLAGWVADKVRGVGATVVDSLKNFFGIKSPSRLMRDQIGKQIGAGLAIGIEQSVDVVKKATQKLTDAATVTVPDIQLPSVNAGTLTATAGGITTTNTQPVLSRTSVYDPSVMTQQGGIAFGQTVPGGVTNVNFQVNPSTGLNEQQIGEAAMEQLYWRLSTTP